MSVHFFIHSVHWTSHRKLVFLVMNKSEIKPRSIFKQRTRMLPTFTKIFGAIGKYANRKVRTVSNIINLKSTYECDKKQIRVAFVLKLFFNCYSRYLFDSP